MWVLGFLRDDIARLIEGKDRLDNVCRFINELQQGHVFGVHEALSHQGVLEPVEQARPEWRAHHDHGYAASFAGLYQG